jgi:hypothetical protein
MVVLLVFVVGRTRDPDDAAKPSGTALQSAGDPDDRADVPPAAVPTFLLRASRSGLRGRTRRRVVATTANALGSVIVVAITLGYAVALMR